jgi:uncharacterized protein YndB with AHSA1/START domain
MDLFSSSERIVGPTLRVASVRVSRLLGAAPDRVFDAWLHAEEASSFLFAHRVGDAVRAEIDARIGGGFRVVRHSQDDAIEYWGEYLEIERPHLLVFSLFVEKYAQLDDRVTVELAPVAEQSLLVLTHELSLANPAERSRIQREWLLALDGLAALCLRAPLSRAVSPRAHRWLRETADAERRAKQRERAWLE